MDLDTLKYPIGKFKFPVDFNETNLAEWIEDLAVLPQQINDVSIGLSNTQLEVSYRPDGWTVRQVINHLADSHINAYCRFHLTLTEDKPIIRPYFEDRWAELNDGKDGDIQHSINIIKGIHARLVALLKTLDPADFNRTYIHPETNKEFTLAYLTATYAWHGKHHLAHIKSTL
jgi:hypothetical protein